MPISRFQFQGRVPFAVVIEVQCATDRLELKEKYGEAYLSDLALSRHSAVASIRLK